MYKSPLKLETSPRKGGWSSEDPLSEHELREKDKTCTVTVKSNFGY